MADDLLKFRENWLKEIGHHKLEDAEPSPLHEVHQVQLQPYHHDQHDHILDHDQEVKKDINPHIEKCHNEKGEAFQEELGNAQAGNNIKWHNVCQNDSSATYYPFRILSALLNRAGTEQEVKKGRGKSKRSSEVGLEKLETATSSKRNYFLTADIDNSNAQESVLKNVKSEVQSDKMGRKSNLDIFIADLDEISEIPFFDVSLPREVAVKIFQHLNIVDLCRCAQVSKSWHSLAEDELLWCRICHKLGFEKNALTIEHENWKERVRQFTVIKQTLEMNWKNRTGKLYNLHYAKGGVLCAVHSNSTTIVAGYSNCQTKLWDVTSGETCIFQPSSTALIIDEAVEEGTINNEVVLVATCNRATAASYLLGFVDVWSNEEGTEPQYSFQLEGGIKVCHPTSLQLLESEQTLYLSVSHGHTVQIHQMTDCEGVLLNTALFDSPVKSTLWLQASDKSLMSRTPATLIVTTNYTVGTMVLNKREAGDCLYDHIELHNIIDAPITCSDARLPPAEVVVGYTLNTGPSQFFKVNIYDIVSCQTKYVLSGHTACVLCVNMADSPPHQLVTGSRDRKVRVYDTRCPPYAVVTLIGHSAAVTTVQMDDGKVVSGDEAGFVCVWDQRMGSKLWEMNNRHPVRYCHFSDRQLTVGHVPYVKHHSKLYEFDTGLHQRHRGSLHVYDFLADQTRQGVPEICLSTYDEPQGYNYNIGLAVPYDQL